MNDSERLDWLEHQGGIGGYGLVSDDNGRWAVSTSGFQNIGDPDTPIDISTTFFVEKDEWCVSVREAIDRAKAEHETDGGDDEGRDMAETNPAPNP